ncbi:hypothetical protein VE01_03426 [Pseudogymnoascus verrucosus]|uniref:Haloacid dehalogenase-like hydrolase n=1 Tax=Pseudogymnoascus verrucosus TaxID=342668 RepID=A0A1B8GSA4_9PEZI|nr:uncharacterized protein VE01_03426 [Pseudogymnoascus verrucosus]OBT98708.2 hypothetical protein VE01_03426 [Pseudogymnoascus verrucosus]
MISQRLISLTWSCRLCFSPQTMILSPRLYLGIFAPAFCPRATVPALSHPFTTHNYYSPIMPHHRLHHRSFQVVLDFDGTITTEDTIEALAQSAIALQNPSLPHSQLSQTPAAEAWNNCKSQYLADLSAHYEKENQEPSDGGVVTGLGGLEREQGSLDALRDVEWASVKRVGQSGIFKGLSKESLREKGRAATAGDPQDGNDLAVVVREGFPEFVTWIGQIGGQWGIVSVNWSRMWVRGVLDVALEERWVPSQIDLCNLTTNDINPLTGMILGWRLDRLSAKRTHLLTTADKLLAQHKMMFYGFDIGVSSPEPLTIYIGDSPTDLSPLLHADIGIIMNSPSSTPGALGALIDKCGYRVLPVSEYEELYRKGEDEKVAILLSVNNFTEIIDSGMLQDEGWDPTAAKKAWKKAESES